MRVRICASNHTDMPPVQWAGRYYYGEMIAAGVQIAEYQPTHAAQQVIIIDGGILGSANMDVRSKELNEENDCNRRHGARRRS